MNPINIILKTLDLIIENGLWPNRKPSEIVQILLYVHNKGWLYSSKSAILCGYRIKEGDSLEEIPLKEEGNILYIPFVLSTNKEDNLFNTVREVMKIYLSENLDIEEIILEDKNNNIKRYSLKGELNGQSQRVETAGHSNVSE